LLIFELILQRTQEKSIQNASFTDIFERFFKELIDRVGEVFQRTPDNLFIKIRGKM
jgi:hypothetical protein